MIKTRQAGAIGWWICGIGALFYCYEYLLRIEPNVMLDRLQHVYHVNTTGLGFIISMYYFAYTPMQLVVGAITDYFGARKVLSAAIIFCVLGSFLFSYTHLPLVAGTGRFLIGMGSAFAFVGALKLASIWLPAKRFALFAGITTSLGMIGAISGDIGLSYLVESIGWQKTMAYSAITGLILIPLIFFGIRKKPADPAQLIKQHPINFQALYLEVFYMLKRPQMWLAGLIGCCLYLSLAAFGESWGVDFIKVNFHVSMQAATVTNTMIFWGWLLGSPIAGWVSDVWRSRRMPLFIGAIGACCCFLLVLFVPMSLTMARIALFFFGFFCSAEILCFAIGRELNKNVYAATAVSFINMVVMLSGMFFQPLIGKLLQWQASKAGMVAQSISQISDHDFKVAFMAIPVALVLTLLMVWRLPESHGRQPH